MILEYEVLLILILILGGGCYTVCYSLSLGHCLTYGVSVVDSLVLSNRKGGR